MALYTLETARLRLRPFTMTDLERAHEQFDVHPDVWRYDPGFPPSREHRRRWLEYRIQELQVHGFGCLAIELKSTDELIGLCGLEFFLFRGQPYSSPEVEIYYRLGRDYWSSGYATEAAAEVLRHAFEDLRLPRVFANAAAANTASIAVLERLGFQIGPDPVRSGEILAVLEAPGRRD